MTDRGWKIFTVLSIVVSLIFVCIDWRMMTGFILGCAASAFVYQNTVHYVDRTLAKHVSTGMAYHLTLNYLIWTAVLILSAVLPQFFNVLCCAAGLFIIRICLIADSFWHKKEA
jgi:uncharacterized membrane-anchored protein